MSSSDPAARTAGLAPPERDALCAMQAAGVLSAEEAAEVARSLIAHLKRPCGTTQIADNFRLA